jgi:hypothetical protein
MSLLPLYPPIQQQHSTRGMKQIGAAGGKIAFFNLARAVTRDLISFG